jgi:hypothetical protein
MIRRFLQALRRLLVILSRSTTGGVPVPARPPRAATGHLRRDRRLWLVLPLVLLLLAAGGIVWRASAPPRRLDDAALIGPRRTQGPVCLAIAGDTSGSMEKLAGVRREALRSLVHFVRRSLADDDLLAAVVFTGAEGVALPATRVADLDQDDLPEPDVQEPGTKLAPAAHRIGVLFPSGGCTQRALVVVTDGLLMDDPDDLARAFAAARLAAVEVLVPDGHGRPAIFTAAPLAGVSVARFDSHDADELGLRYGNSLATLTGQHLGRRR